MPFLAPALPILNAIGTVGGVVSGIAGGRAQGRRDEADANQRQDALRQRGQELALRAPSDRARNAVRGDILANVQPLSINGPITHTGGRMPQISGGLSPDLLSDTTRRLGGQISRDALLSQLKGDEQFAPTPLPEPNFFDRILSTVGTVGSLAGGVGEAGNDLGLGGETFSPFPHPRPGTPNLPFQPLPRSPLLESPPLPRRNIIPGLG